MARQKAHAGSEPAAAAGRLSLEDAAQILLATPGAYQMWSAAEVAALRRLYPEAAARRQVGVLAKMWPQITGCSKSTRQLIAKARNIGLQNGPDRRP